MTDYVRGSSVQQLGLRCTLVDGGPYALEDEDDLSNVLDHTIYRDLIMHKTYSKDELREALFRRLVKWKTELDENIGEWFKMALRDVLFDYAIRLMDNGEFWVTGSIVGVHPGAVIRELIESGYWERVEEYIGKL